MSLQGLIESMTPEVYERLKTAVELGKWPDGTVLSDEQKETSFQAVMAYQAKFNTDPQHFTIGQGGELVMKSKTELKNQYKETASIEMKTLD